MNGTQKHNNTEMEKISKYNNMEIEQFYKDLESKYNKAIYRRILVKLVEGKKQCSADHKNWTPEKIKTNRGWGNTFSFSIKHIDNLYVIDFDTKNLDGCKLWDLLDGCAFTETNKGFHKYVYIKNLPLFKNQQKVYFDTKYEIDLLKDNNCWETADRTISGDIMTFEWEDLKGYFNTKHMNFVDDVQEVESPPVTPPASVDEEFVVETIEIPKCSAEDMIKYLTNIKPRYDYDTWTKIGFIIYNNFDGDDEGLDIYVDYTKKDKEYYTEHKHRTLGYISRKWEGLNSGDGNKVSYKQLIRWNLEDYPPKNKYEGWFKCNTLMQNMNEEIMYCREGECIIQLLDDGGYLRMSTAGAGTYYNKYGFKYTEKYFDDKGVEKEKEVAVRPYDYWINNIDRKDVINIIFDPQDRVHKDRYNIYKGMDYVKNGDYDIDKIQHFLDHIKDILCDGNVEVYEYTMNWFARIIQTPHLKNKVGLVWYSEEEGVGKNIVLDVIRDIMGSDYYYSTSCLENLLGNFNAAIEGKILINLNECTWGGDKKKEGRLKELITENQITINQKNVKTYSIDNYANVVVTSNNDWILGINKNDRRWQMVTCSNQKFDSSYYKLLAGVDKQHLCNYFHSINLDNYDPTKRIKTELHHQQVEQNMDSTEMYWRECLETRKIANCTLCDDEDCLMELPKNMIFDDYYTKSYGTHCSKTNVVHFWRRIRKYCKHLQFNTKKQTCKFPSVQAMMMDYNEYTKYAVFSAEDMEPIIDECDIE